MTAATASAVGSAFEIIIEIFGWIGLLGAVLLGIATLVVWAADGTWLPASAIVDRDEPRVPSGAQHAEASTDTAPARGSAAVLVRWFDDVGDARSAVLSRDDAAAVDGRDSAEIWYRHGWQGRARLARRAPALRPLLFGALGLTALAVLSLVVSLVLMFTAG